jgi:hypothetical protein
MLAALELCVVVPHLTPIAGLCCPEYRARARRKQAPQRCAQRKSVLRPAPILPAAAALYRRRMTDDPTGLHPAIDGSHCI